MSTPFDEPSLELLERINVDIIKIASFDIGNLSFINKISKNQKTCSDKYWRWQIRTNTRKYQNFRNKIKAK